SSSEENAFTGEHQALLDGVVDLLGVAFEHTSIVDRETLRRERIDSLRGLLHTMAEALDVRTVFADVSDVVRGGLPHDILVLTSWGGDGASFRIYAIAGAEVGDPDLLGSYTLSGDDLVQLQRGAYVIRDVDSEVQKGTIRSRIFH